MEVEAKNFRELSPPLYLTEQKKRKVVAAAQQRALVGEGH